MRRDVAVAALAIGALLIVSFLTAKKPAAPSFASRSSSDYSFGGYHAWYDLMTREGVDVTRWRVHHDALTPEVDTLVMAFPDSAFGYDWDDGEREAVRAWIRAGGRLIDIGATPATRHTDQKAEVIIGKTARRNDGPLHGPWAAQVVTLPARGPIRLRAQGKHRVETLLADSSGPLVVRYRMGHGDVIAVASAALFENRNLTHGDAARLAYLLAQPRHAGGALAFDEAIRGDVVEKAWYRALDAPELVGLAILALAGALWLAYGFFPLGPAVRLRAAREPTSREFLDAVAALYARARARGHARDALLADARRNLERAPRTPENIALLAQAGASATRTVTTDAELVGIAVLARTAREEIIRAGRNAAINRRRTPAGRAGAGHRRR